MARPCLTGALARPVVRLASALVLVSSLVPAAHALVPRVNAISTPPGWSGPAVPTTGGGYVDTLAVPVSPTLTGGGTTYLHWATSSNATAIGGWRDRLLLDGQVIETLTRPDDPRYLTHWFRAVDQGPMRIRGGRHTLTIEADFEHLAGESPSDYADNTWSGQFVWSPSPHAWGGIDFGPVPPARGGSANPNCDGWSTTLPSGTAWSLGIASTGDDDLKLFSDYAGSTSGFSSVAGASAGPTGVEFLVGRSVAPVTVFPGVESGTVGVAAPFSLSSSDATGRTGSVPAVWGATLAGFRVTETYLVHFTGGAPVTITLARGAADPGFGVAVFPGDVGAVHPRGEALASSGELDAMTEGMVWTPPATGDYPLVVFRREGTNLAAAGSYVLELTAAAGVERAAAPLALAAPVPNPARGSTRLAYSLARAGRVTLALIDVQGRRVSTLLEGDQAAGVHELEWDGRGADGARLSPGSYWLRLETPEGTRTRPLTLTR